MDAKKVEKMAEKRDIKGLIKALSHGKNQFVRQEAARALGELKDPHAVEPLIKELGGIEKYKEAAAALGKIKDPRAVEPLIEALCDRFREAKRKSAAEALGELKDPRAVEPLIKALGDDDSKVRFAATMALGKIKDARAVEPLIKTLGDRDPKVRFAATRALGKIKDPRTVEPLIEAISDQSSEVSGAATEAIERLKDPRAIEPLIKVLGDMNGEVRIAVAKALEKFGEQKWKDMIKGDLDDFIRLGDSKDPRAIEPLLTALYFSNELEFGAVAKGLGRLKDPKAIEPLLEALISSRPDVRKAAADSLALLGEQKWTEIVYGDDGDYQRIASDNDTRIKGLLIHMLTYGKTHEQSAAAKLLGELEDHSAFEILANKLNDLKVRSSAVEALGKLKDIKAIPLLIPFLTSDRYNYTYLPKVAAEAILTIMKANPEANFLNNRICTENIGEHADLHYDDSSNSSDCTHSDHHDTATGISLNEFLKERPRLWE